MGLYLNPGNEEFRNAAIHSKIYVDKTEMIKFTNSQLFGEHKTSVSADHGVLENQWQPICWWHITAKAAIRRNCLKILK